MFQSKNCLLAYVLYKNILNKYLKKIYTRIYTYMSNILLFMTTHTYTNI